MTIIRLSSDASDKIDEIENGAIEANEVKALVLFRKDRREILLFNNTPLIWTDDEFFSYIRGK